MDAVIDDDEIKKRLDAIPEEDFYSYILYVLRDDANSDNARRLSHQDVYVQSVEDLAKPYPDWLVGVPTLYEKVGKKVYRGTACLDHLQIQ